MINFWSNKIKNRDIFEEQCFNRIKILDGMSKLVIEYYKPKSKSNQSTDIIMKSSKLLEIGKMKLKMYL